MSFWRELGRRNVYKVGAAYVIVAWLIAQVASVFAPALNLPSWTLGLVALLLILGFPVALFLAWAYELTPEGVRQTRHVPTTESITRVTGRRLNYLVIVLLAIAVVFLAFDDYFRADRPAPPASTAAAVENSPFPENSIAVLPFVNMSSDAEQEYFSDGLSEEILNQLAQLEGLHVAGRTSSFTFKGQNIDLREIGETLNVAYVLEGSVRTIDNDLRITAQLVDTMDGFHLWSRTFARELGDVFAVQEEISREVAQAMTVELGVADAQIQFGGTERFEAYDLYLRGLSLSDNDPERAIEILRASIEVDPEFPRPWMALTYAYGRVLQNSLTLEEAQQALTRMEESALRTVELAPDRWEGQSALLWTAVARKDWVSAHRAHVRAQELAAAAGVRMDDRSYANFFHQIGHVERSLAGNEARVRDDPLNPVASFDLQIDLLLRGRYEEVIREVERSRDLPGSLNAIDLFAIPWLMEQGEDERVDRLLEAGNPLQNRLAAVWTSRDEALRVLREIAAEPGYLSRRQLGTLPLFAAYYGDNELAVDLLRRAFLGEGYAGFFLIWHPTLSSVRRTEGFRQFLRDVGFVELWREMGDWGNYCEPVGADDFQCV